MSTNLNQMAVIATACLALAGCMSNSQKPENTAANDPRSSADRTMGQAGNVASTGSPSNTMDNSAAGTPATGTAGSMSGNESANMAATGSAGSGNAAGGMNPTASAPMPDAAATERNNNAMADDRRAARIDRN
jgi:hypothetical protein